MRIFTRTYVFQGFFTKIDPKMRPRSAKIAPRQPQGGLSSMFFSLRFLHRILVAFWVDFGVIWGGFWEPKSVIFGIDFLMIFSCRSKSGQERPKSTPERPKSAPRAPQTTPRAPETTPRASETTPRAPKTSKSVSKSVLKSVSLQAQPASK